jgi:ApaG protein
MEIAITKGVKVSVATRFVPEYEASAMSQYVYTYEICIENTTDYTVQLLRRSWQIIDANGILREIEGEGVVGLQPTIGPQESFSYASWVGVNTDVGKMFGTFLMVRQMDGELFQAEIPEFALIASFKLN